MKKTSVTNPDATSWFQGKLRVLLEQGIDARSRGDRNMLNVLIVTLNEPGYRQDHQLTLAVAELVVEGGA